MLQIFCDDSNDKCFKRNVGIHGGKTKLGIVYEQLEGLCSYLQTFVKFNFEVKITK